MADLRADVPRFLGHPAYPHVVDLLSATREPIQLVPYAPFVWAVERGTDWQWQVVDGNSAT